MVVLNFLLYCIVTVTVAVVIKFCTSENNCTCECFGVSKNEVKKTHAWPSHLGV